MSNRTSLAEHAITLADLAASEARAHFRKPLGVEFKADESPVTQADRAVETKVRAYLAKHFPDHGIFGEEHGIEGADKEDLWIIDPIDGTRSFLTGHPLFGFLLGLVSHGTPQLGVVGMPAMGETYLGVAGQGATLNGAPISASQQTDLAQARLYINEGEKIYRDHPQVFARLLHAGQTRRLAYDCYPHALLASGHLDVVVDYDLQPYDYLPVSALIEAAGGIMTDWDGAPLTLHSDGRVVSAATPELHQQILETVNR